MEHKIGMELQASYLEAAQLCSDQGLQVTSLASKKESSKMDEYMNYIGIKLLKNNENNFMIACNLFTFANHIHTSPMLCLINLEYHLKI